MKTLLWRIEVGAATYIPDVRSALAYDVEAGTESAALQKVARLMLRLGSTVGLSFHAVGAKEIER